MYQQNTKGWFKHLDFMLLDLLCLQAAFFLSCIVRLGSFNPYAVVLYRNMGVLIEIFDLVVMLLYGTLHGVIRRGYYVEFTRTVKHTLWLFAMCVMYLFAVQSGGEYSRLSFFLMFIFYLVLTYVIRIGWKAVLHKRTGNLSDHTMIVITFCDVVEEIISRLNENLHTQARIVGVILADEDRTGGEICGYPVVAGPDMANEYICRSWVDEVFIYYPKEKEIPWEKIRSLSETGVVIHLNLEGGIESIGQNQIIERFGGYTVFTSALSTMSHRQAFFKRALDICGGLVGSIITLILFVFLAPAIYIKSPGPIFFKQTRVGRNGRKFKMYKFRSMYMDAEERKTELYEKNRVKDGMMFKLDFDPRVIGNEILPDGSYKTGIGDFIRRKSLDEFPQFFNVLKGDMSLVGTRPPTLDEWEKYELHHRARLAAKPGITGLWQVSGRSEIQDFEEVVKLDVQYISEWNMGLDIKILLKTVAQVLKGEGAL